MSFKHYRDQEVWQKAMDLIVKCYKITKKFPKDESYWLTSQVQLVSVLIPANIAKK